MNLDRGSIASFLFSLPDQRNKGIKMIEFYDRKAVFSELKEYCIMAKEFDFIEITEWKNGEGFDINVSSTLGNQIISLTAGEFRLIKKMVKELNS